MDTGITGDRDIDTKPAPAQAGSFFESGELSGYSVEWSDGLRITPRGGMAYFAHFLKSNGLFDDLAAQCPLTYSSNNAPDKRDVLGTVVCGLVNGARRYAHLSHLQGDALCARMLGLEGGFVSEDSVRRGFRKGAKADWPAFDGWLRKAELASVAPLLGERYILDLDTSVRQIYGRQEGAEVGYNPRRPNRPSQCLHVAFIGSLRMLVGVDVQGGKAHASCHMARRVWDWVDALPGDMRPSLTRGDIGFGTEGYLGECERRSLPHLFKLKMSARVKGMVRGLVEGGSGSGWVATEKGWEVAEATLKLSGWSRERRVVVMRRPFVEGRSKSHDMGQWLPGLDMGDVTRRWEYAVLVCSADLPIGSLPLLYAERADCENVLDELKNQWGWAGFTTRDIMRCKVMARLNAVVYNWWNVFARLAQPAEHMEALTSRPELLYVIIMLVVHGGKKTLRACSQHENAASIRRAFGRLHRAFAAIDAIAEQLGRSGVWRLQLSLAFYAWLRGKVLKMPDIAQKTVRQLAMAPP